MQEEEVKKTCPQNDEDMNSPAETKVPLKNTFSKNVRKVFHVFDKVFDYILIPLLHRL